jgi:hypothetical protein
MAPSTACPVRAQPALYEIRLRGELDADWAGWFSRSRHVSTVTVHAALGETTIRGQVADQGALFSLLIKVRDLGLPLLFVQRVESHV